MNKSTKTEKTEAATPTPAPQTKRYDEAFKRQAVENWIKTGKPGTAAQFLFCKLIEPQTEGGFWFAMLR